MESNVPYDRKAEIGRVEELAMTTAALGTTDTRTRLIEAAIDLFTRHSFAGTSLQMIAELRTVVESAETKRTPHARAEHMLNGYAALAVRNRGLVAVLATDPSVATVVTDRAEWGNLIMRQLALLADVDPGPAGEVKAAMVFAGMAGATGPTWGNLDDDALRE